MKLCGHIMQNRKISKVIAGKILTGKLSFWDNNTERLLTWVWILTAISSSPNLEECRRVLYNFKLLHQETFTRNFTAYKLDLILQLLFCKIHILPKGMHLIYFISTNTHKHVFTQNVFEDRTKWCPPWGFKQSNLAVQIVHWLDIY